MENVWEIVQDGRTFKVNQVPHFNSSTGILNFKHQGVQVYLHPAAGAIFVRDRSDRMNG